MRKLYSFLIGILGIIVILMSGSIILQKNSESDSRSDKLVIYNWALRSNTKHSILMKQCIPKSSKAAPPTILLFRVII